MINKKIFIAIIAIILVLSLIVIVKINIPTKQPETEYYFNPLPESWIEEDTSTEDNEDMIINVYKATKTLGYFDGLREEFIYFGKRVTFFYHGYYKGNYFDELYVGNSFFETRDANYPINEINKEFVKMKISNKINPKDGVIEGFILGKFEDNELVFYAFVDEDWRKQVEYTNILWANDFSEMIYEKKFEFNDPINGIYVNKINGDFNWFKQARKGGILVGEIYKEIIKDNIFNGTLMYVR